jgi:OMF family outer membrane factor
LLASAPVFSEPQPTDAQLLSPDTEFNDGPPIFDKNSILLKPPELKALVTIDEQMSPFGLDSTSTQPIDLRQVLRNVIDNSLDIAISRTNDQATHWQFRSSLGHFIPDLILGYQEYWLKGGVAFPFNPATFVKGLPLPANFQQQAGTTVAHIDSPFVISRAGFNWNVFNAKNIYTAMESRHTWHAAHQGQQATMSDTLLSATQGFYQMLLNEALLQIRIRAVQTSQEQLKVNRDRFELGLSTNLDVLQATTQLSRDRQDLIDQQVSRRTSAIKLADIMNSNLGTDLTPSDMVVRKVRLVSPRMRVPDVLKLAIDNRPELKQYEELRLAAKKAIGVSAAPLAPTLALGGGVFGIGPGIAQQQALFNLNLNLRWDVNGMGVTDYASTRAAKLQARQAQLQAQKELVTVLDQVRSSYLQSLDAERKIDETDNEAQSSLEELRLARLRYQHGLGTNLDIITGQRDYTRALIDKAQAIINFNTAQAQLVHDMGLSSFDSYTSGRLIGG